MMSLILLTLLTLSKSTNTQGQEQRRLERPAVLTSTQELGQCTARRPAIVQYLQSAVGSASSSEHRAIGSEWTGSMRYHDYGTMANVTMTITDLKQKFKEEEDNIMQLGRITHVKIYRIPLSDWQWSNFLLYHAYVVFKTVDSSGTSWWSLEKNGQYLDMQHEDAVIDDHVTRQLRGEMRRRFGIWWQPQLIAECTKPDCTLSHLFDSTLENQLDVPYMITDDNCKMFAKTIFERICPNDKWDYIGNSTVWLVILATVVFVILAFLNAHSIYVLFHFEFRWSKKLLTRNKYSTRFYYKILIVICVRALLILIIVCFIYYILILFVCGLLKRPYITAIVIISYVLQFVNPDRLGHVRVIMLCNRLVWVCVTRAMLYCGVFLWTGSTLVLWNYVFHMCKTSDNFNICIICGLLFSRHPITHEPSCQRASCPRASCPERAEFHKPSCSRARCLPLPCECHTRCSHGTCDCSDTRLSHMQVGEAYTRAMSSD